MEQHPISRNCLLPVHKNSFVELPAFLLNVLTAHAEHVSPPSDVPNPAAHVPLNVPLHPNLSAAQREHALLSSVSLNVPAAVHALATLAAAEEADHAEVAVLHVDARAATIEPSPVLPLLSAAGGDSWPQVSYAEWHARVRALE